MPRIVALPVLQHFHMRHRTDPCQLGHFRRDIADHQHRVGPGEPRGQLRHGLPNARPAERRAMHRVRRVGGIVDVFVSCGLKERRQGNNLNLPGEGGKDIGLGAKDGHRLALRQRVDHCGATFRMAPALMVDEVTDGPGHCATILTGGSIALRAKPKVSSPSKTPAAWAARAW